MDWQITQQTSPRISTSSNFKSKLAITHLKFAKQPEKYKCISNSSSHAFSPTITLQNWRRNLLTRSQNLRKQVKKGSENHLLFDEVASDQSTNMFLGWQKRHQSTKPLIPNENIFQEVLRSIKSQNIQRARSERKFPTLYDACPKNNTQQKFNSSKPSLNLPIELITRKLQWQGKIVKKPIAYNNQKLIPKIQYASPRIQIKEKVCLLRLSGWEGNIDEDIDL